jgi:tRNA threonylcarbamoyl adenosine modification protein (Sua5/YciO/YrdC/YwlC family)
MAAGGLAVFPADTVYGIACDPGNRFAVERLYLLKRRSLAKPSAVMFFDVSLALESLPELGPRTRNALTRLLPGGVMLLVPNPAARFPLACGEDKTTLGVRVPAVELLSGVRWPVLQSSANRAGGPDPQRLEQVPELIRAAADLVIDGGELPGTPSTIVDLRSYEDDGTWSIVRAGAVITEEIATALDGQFHFDPDSYLEMMHSEVPEFDRLQEAVTTATGTGAVRILELGTGTGETARRLLERHREAELVGIDASDRMLAVARAQLPPERAQLRVGRLEDPLPDRGFDLAASALAIHHLDGPAKAALFARVRRALAAGGRFVIGDVIVPEDPADATTPLMPGFDRPSTIAEQLAWLGDAGFEASVAWRSGDLAVIVAVAREGG